MYPAALLFTLDAQALLNSPVVAALLIALIGSVLAWHPLKKAGVWLLADAAHRTGLLKSLEADGSTLAGELDDFLTANGQDVKALLDPAKRAAAEAHLAAQGKAAVAAAVAKATEAPK